MAQNPRVEVFFNDAKKWGREASELIRVLLDCGLTEVLMWRKPCYADNGRNVCIIQSFKYFVPVGE